MMQMLRTVVLVGVIASLTSVAMADDKKTGDEKKPGDGEWTGALPAPPPEPQQPPAQEPAQQPPGTPPPASGPPATTTPDLLHPPPPAPSVMDRRWSISAGLGWESLTIQHGEKQKVTFGMLELSARFRIRPAIQVGLVLTGGGTAGDISLGGLYAEFRYRFRVEEKWNLWAGGALGSMGAGQKKATDDEKAGRGSLRLGGGLERRFGGFAVDVQLHIVAIGENKKAPDPDPVTPTTAGQLSRYGLSGGSLMIGVTYYF
jgi:hypothetical protein